MKRMIEAINIKHWGKINGNQLAEELGLSRFILLNDFHCAAFSANGLAPEDLVCIREGSRPGGDVKLMVGLGTGLGIAFTTRASGPSFLPFASEGGWMHFLEISDEDRGLAAFLRSIHKCDIISFEQVCCGPSLTRLLNYSETRSGKLPSDMTPREICGRYEIDSHCRFAVDRCLQYLGRFLCQMSLIFKPYGGIYLTGGAMGSLFPLISKSDDFERGLNSQTHPILAKIGSGPAIFYIRRADVGLLGARYAAMWFDNAH